VGWELKLLDTKSQFNEGGDHAVLLVHGLSSSPLEMRFLARALARSGFTTYAPTFDGYSAGSPERKMEEWLAAAVGKFDELSQRYKRVSVCGLSIGATLALALVKQRPSAQAVILLSVTLAYDGWAIPWYQFLLGLAYYTPMRGRWRYREESPFGLKNEALRAKISRAMQSNAFSEIGPSTISLSALHEASRLAKSVRGFVGDIKTDCLTIHAIDDETANANNARFVSSHIGAAFVRCIYLDDSYHMITSDNEREIVAREVSLFLRESEAAQGGMPGEGTPIVSKALARRLRHIAKPGG
jgi:carboxylesterase